MITLHLYAPRFCAYQSRFESESYIRVWILYCLFKNSLTLSLAKRKRSTLYPGVKASIHMKWMLRLIFGHRPLHGEENKRPADNTIGVEQMDFADKVVSAHLPFVLGEEKPHCLTIW